MCVPGMIDYMLRRHAPHLTHTKSWATRADSLPERLGTASHSADTMNPASCGL